MPTGTSGRTHHDPRRRGATPPVAALVRATLPGRRFTGFRQLESMSSRPVRSELAQRPPIRAPGRAAAGRVGSFNSGKNVRLPVLPAAIRVSTVTPLPGPAAPQPQ